ncbi:MAG: hypothetical protein IJB10_04160 [Clostridia bacterium]|nr:hypothetical protein [Clostridia bacterium]
MLEVEILDYIEEVVKNGNAQIILLPKEYNEIYSQIEEAEYMEDKDCKFITGKYFDISYKTYLEEGKVDVYKTLFDRDVFFMQEIDEIVGEISFETLKEIVLKLMAENKVFIATTDKTAEEIFGEEFTLKTTVKNFNINEE